MSLQRMQTSLMAWRSANCIGASIVAELAEGGRRPGAAAQAAAQPDAGHRRDVGEREEKVVRDLIAEDELGADAQGADHGEEERRGGGADRVRRAEDDR